MFALAVHLALWIFSDADADAGAVNSAECGRAQNWRLEYGLWGNIRGVFLFLRPPPRSRRGRHTG